MFWAGEEDTELQAQTWVHRILRPSHHPYKILPRSNLVAGLGLSGQHTKKEHFSSSPPPHTHSPPTCPPRTHTRCHYVHIVPPPQVRDLFKYIGRYKPHTIELATTLKPFVPDYIPSVGGIDEFIKVWGVDIAHVNTHVCLVVVGRDVFPGGGAEGLPQSIGVDASVGKPLKWHQYCVCRGGVRRLAVLIVKDHDGRMHHSPCNCPCRLVRDYKLQLRPLLGAWIQGG
eukprot:353364-Chlamydomonas_euryale.AAC.10